MSSFDETRGGYRDPALKRWPDHRGREVEGLVYWTPPSPAVGEVVSAYSNQGEEGFRLPISAAQRALLMLILLAVGVAMATMATLLVSNELLGFRLEPWPIALACVLPIGLLLRWLMKPRPLCTYVGVEGASEHRRGPFKESHLDLCFADAEALTTAVVRRYTNGVYQGTDYRFVWWSAGRDPVFTFRGTRREPGFSFAQKEDPSWDFALAAEAMWNRHRFPQMEAQMEKEGFVAFRVGQARYLYVYEDKLELEDKGGPRTFPQEEIQSLRVEDGCLKICEEGSSEGLFRVRGVHRLPISEIDNYTLLLRALERWSGLRLPELRL